MLPTHLTTLTGAEITRLMNQHRMTIAAVADRLGVTKLRVRQVRANGVSGYAFICDWQEAIMGRGTFNLRVWRNCEAAK